VAYATHTQGLKALFEPQGHVEGKKHAKEACGDRASGCKPLLQAMSPPDEPMDKLSGSASFTVGKLHCSGLGDVGCDGSDGCLCTGLASTAVGSPPRWLF